MSIRPDIYDAIAAEGFSSRVLELIDNYVNEIVYGTASFSRFNLQEHAGLCTAGPVLIGASVVADYARGSFEAGCHAESGQGSFASNLQIDALQEKLIEPCIYLLNYTKSARCDCSSQLPLPRNGYECDWVYKR